MQLRKTMITTGWALCLLMMSVSLKAEEKQHYDRVNLTVSAQQEVENDTLIAVLSVHREGTELDQLADAVNQVMGRAMKRSQQVKEVDISTQAYQTRPRYQKQRLIGWTVRQSLRLESQKVDVLSQLLGELQSDLAIESLGYAVSTPQRESVEQALIRQAIARFKQRADNVTRQLGRESYRLVSMDIATPNPANGPRPMRSAMMMQEQQVTPPQVALGTQTMTVTVNASIELGVK